MGDEPITQVFIESEIIRLCALAERVTHEIAKRARDAAVADSDYRRIHASAYLQSSGKTVGEREAQAALAADEAYTQRRITEALLMSARSAGENYRTQISALQTLASNIRALVTGG